jgi:hypothetical protein
LALSLCEPWAAALVSALPKGRNEALLGLLAGVGASAYAMPLLFALAALGFSLSPRALRQARR